MTYRLLSLSSAILVVSSLAPFARAADLAEELRFAQALRAERYYDLAEQQLTRMEKMGFPPSVAADIETERLNIQLDRAGDEPDTAKRLARYDEVRMKFAEKAKDKAHPVQAANARLVLVNITLAQARIQLSVALSRKGQERVTEGYKARDLLNQAQKQLEEVVKDLDDQVKKTPDARDKAHLENSARQVRFDLALNIFEQAITYPESGIQAIRKQRSDKVEEAKKAFTVIASGSPTSSQSWLGKAWLARCAIELGESDSNISEALDAVLNAKEPAAVDGKRLALYFRILRDKEKATDKVKAVDEGTAQWLKEYGRFKNTVEGFGVRFLRSEVLLERARQAQGLAKEKLLNEARTLVNDLELTDNEYTDRALTIKLAIIDMQGGFAKPVAELNTFEDCFLRARFELYRADEEARAEAKVEHKNKDEVRAAQEKLREAQEKHFVTALSALERGLTMPDISNPENLRAKPRLAANMATARSALPFYFTQLARARESAQDRAQANRYLRDAIRTGEPFARNNPDAEGADQCAIYVIDAYKRLIGKDGSQQDRAKFKDFADFVEAKWVKGPGNLVRLNRAELLLEDGTAKPDQRVENVKQAIQILGRISEDYAGFPYAQSRLAEAAQMADREKFEPIKPAQGQPELSYRQIAMAALRRIPEPKGDDPDANRRFVRSRIKIADEMYKEGRAALNDGQAALKAAADMKGPERDVKLSEGKNKIAEGTKEYKEMDALVGTLLERVGKLDFVAAEAMEGVPEAKRKEAEAKRKEQEETYRGNFRSQLESYRLFAIYGLADGEMTEGNYAAAATRLDPFVDRIKADTLPALRDNPALALGILNIALKANVQINKTQRLPIIVHALVDSEINSRVRGTPPADLPKAKEAAREPAVAAILTLLVNLVKRQTQEMTDNKNLAGLEAFKKGMPDVFVTLEQMLQNPSNDTLYWFSQAWFALGNPTKAMPYLDKITEPKAAGGMPPAQREVDLYRMGRILYIRLLRADKQYAKAKQLIAEAKAPIPMNPPPKDAKDQKYNWGASNIDILKEEALVLADEGEYVQGGKKASALLKPLNKGLDGPNGETMKQHYLEMYHLFIYCIVKNGHKLKDPKDQNEQIHNAAEHLLQVETRFKDFGGGDIGKRFQDLLKTEPQLKAEYLKQKAVKVTTP